MEISTFSNSGKSRDERIYYYAASENKILNLSSKTFQDIFTKRPYTFCVTTSSSIEVSIDRANEVFDEFNYNYQFKNNGLIGIRSDLYVLGFGFDQLSLISASPKKEDLAKDLIAQSLENTQTRTSYSREEEIEILSEIL